MTAFERLKDWSERFAATDTIAAEVKVLVEEVERWRAVPCPCPEWPDCADDEGECLACADYRRHLANSDEAIEHAVREHNDFMQELEEHRATRRSLDEYRDIVAKAEIWRHWWLKTHGRTFRAGDSKMEELIHLRDAAEEALEKAVAELTKEPT